MALIGWTTANYFSYTLTNPESIFFSIKLIFAFVILQNTAFFLFVNIFPSAKNTLNRAKVWMYLAANAVLVGLALAGVFFKGYIYEAGDFNLLAAPAIILFMASAVFSIGWGLKRLIGRYRRSTGLLRSQLLFLTTASALLLILVPLTNFLLPVAFQNSAFVAASPIYTFTFALIIAYAIIKQRLFDIRLVVARSVAYVLALITLGLIYGSALFILSTLFFSDLGTQSSTQLAINVLIAVLLAFSLQPIKRLFDKVSNALFYRDAYDSQSVLREINRILTREISLEVITKECLRIICSHLKISHGYFVVVEGGNIYHTVYFGDTEKLLRQPTKDILEITKNVVVAEELTGGQTKDLLDEYRAVVSLRMATQKGVIGYILLSSKKSGNTYTSRDIRLLTIISNELAIGVENARAFEEISRFNITLQEKIDAATRELRRVNHRLRELDKTKDEFISMASHQLRTPLTSVKGYLSMILEGDVGPVTKNERQYIQRAYEASQRMVYLIADMLNVSRLQTGKFVIENKPTNLVTAVESEVAQVQELAAAKKLKFNFHRPEKFPTLSLDETKIQQVIMNFLDNAIYYTPPGGTVTVDLKATDSEVIFTVTDTGVGVPASVQHHLFGKFYRADNARKLRPDGTGLGLFMAKKVIVTQGGAIIFKSAEGKGSTFGFSFPRKTTEVRKDAKPVPKSRVANNLQRTQRSV